MSAEMARGRHRLTEIVIDAKVVALLKEFRAEGD